MIKKSLNILLAFVFLFATTGITIYSHYCGGYMVEQSVYFKTEGCCEGFCKCCHTEVLSVKVTDNFLSEKLELNFTKIISKLLDINKYTLEIASYISKSFSSQSTGREVIFWLLHPLLPAEKTSILCVFRL
jgi:hypothetical protein